MVAPETSMARPARSTTALAMTQHGTRRRVGRLCVAALVLLGASACGEETPTAYSEAVEANFLEQCVGAGGDGSESPEVEELRNECSCMYDSLRDNLDFDEFKELDTDVRADQDELPDNINDLLVRCVIDTA